VSNITNSAPVAIWTLFALVACQPAPLKLVTKHKCVSLFLVRGGRETSFGQDLSHGVGFFLTGPPGLLISGVSLVGF
jgi:hypothetical protein